MSRVVAAGLAIVALATGAKSGSADGTSYYRIGAEAAAVITTLSREGLLTWSNGVESGTWRIERSASLAEARWEPYSRGVITNSLLSARVHDFGAPEGEAFIPGGRFTMGDVLGDHSTSTPAHTVDVSPFFMKKHEVNNREMRDVMQWAYEHGLVSEANGTVRTTSGSGTVLLGLTEYASEITLVNGKFVVKAGKENHPCVYVSWYGAAAYCNYRSLMEGRDPCYDLSNWSCDLKKVAYRLPSEAEWEIAARGGYEGRRFPWGDSDLITHARANYRSSTNNWYDVSPSRGFHPDYAAQPLRTSPVGAFPPNNYGVFDLCGNVWEWCWDWGVRYPAGLQTDPTGPTNGTFKVFRGGSNFTTAERVTCSMRYLSAAPSDLGYDIGFRTVVRYAP